MNTIIKGHLANIESWIERIQFSKTIPARVPTTFEFEHKTDTPLRLLLLFWDSIDAQPCFAFTDSGRKMEDINWPSDLTLVSVNSSDDELVLKMTLTGIADITEKMEPSFEDGTFQKTVETTNGYFACRES